MIKEDFTFYPDGKYTECKICGICAFPHIHRTGTSPKDFEQIIEKEKLPSEEIREIWDEMKELKRLRENPVVDKERNTITFDDKIGDLSVKFDEVDTLFGHESTLLKAIIYYQDKQKNVRA